MQKHDPCLDTERSTPKWSNSTTDKGGRTEDLTNRYFKFHAQGDHQTDTRQNSQEMLKCSRKCYWGKILCENIVRGMGDETLEKEDVSTCKC